MAGAALVALALRLVHLWTLLEVDPELIAPVMDARSYHDMALEIMEDPVGKEVFFQSPAYPYGLALVYALFGVGATQVAVVQAVMASLSAGLLGWIGARLDPTRGAWVGVAAAWMFALYRPFVYYSPLGLKVEATTFASLVALALFVEGLARARGRGWAWMLAAGLGLGVLGLVRGNFFMAVPPLALWIGARWWWRAEDPEEDWRGLSAARAGALAGCFVAGFAAVLLLVGARNHAVSGQWVFGNANGGAVLYLGNNPYSPLGEYAHMPFVRPNPLYEGEDFQAEASRRAGRPLTASEASAFWKNEAIAFSVDNPGLTARRVVNKLARVVQSYELGDNYSLQFHSLQAPLLRLPLLSWSLLLGLALAGLLASRGWGRRMAPVWILGGVYLGSLLIFFVRSRYRIPLAPFMMLMAGVGVVQAVGWAREKTWTPVAVGAGVTAALTAVSLWIGLPREANENMAWWYGSLAVSHFEKGEVAIGRGLTAKALEAGPPDATILLHLGRAHLDQDDLDGAIALCGRAVEMDPKRPEQRECLAFALAQRGQLDAAAGVLEGAFEFAAPSHRYALAALIHAQLGDMKRAMALLDAGLAIHPGAPDLLGLKAQLASGPPPGAPGAPGNPGNPGSPGNPPIGAPPSEAPTPDPNAPKPGDLTPGDPTPAPDAQGNPPDAPAPEGGANPPAAPAPAAP